MTAGAVLVSTDLAVAYVVGQCSGRTVADTSPAVLNSVRWMIYNRTRDRMLADRGLELVNYGGQERDQALWSLDEIDAVLKSDRACLWPSHVA